MDDYTLVAEEMRGNVSLLCPFIHLRRDAARTEFASFADRLEMHEL